MPDLKKPSLALAFGPAPDSDADLPDDGPAAGDGLQQACNELIDALGVDVPAEKRPAVCEALKAFVSMASSAPPPDDDEPPPEAA